MFDYKDVLKKIGYSARCKECDTVEFHRGRFLSDMLLTFFFVLIAYVYITEERPYIDNFNNCTYTWQYMEYMKMSGSFEIGGTKISIREFKDWQNERNDFVGENVISQE